MTYHQETLTQLAAIASGAILFAVLFEAVSPCSVKTDLAELRASRSAYLAELDAEIEAQRAAYAATASELSALRALRGE
jgi:Skp family chaperone for outer membrane proteins